MASLLHRLIKGYGLLIAALIVFTACAFLSLSRIRVEHEVETRATALNFWAVTQAESELQLLINALDGYVLGYLGVSHQDLVDRLDLFWSRMPILVNGPDGERIRHMTDAAAVAETALEVLQQLEPALLQLRQDDTASHARIHAELSRLQPQLHNLLIDTNRAFAVDNAHRSGEFDRLYNQHFAYQIGILISASIFILFLVREIRAARAAERRAEDARGQLQSILDAIPVRISVTDAEPRLLLVNRYQRDLEGLDESRIIGQRPSAVGMGAKADELTLKVVATGRALPQFEETHCDRQGWERTWLTTKVPILDTDGQVKRVLSASLDITDRKAAEARLAHLALHDPLTDLPNRTLFHDRLAQELRRAERDGGGGVAVMCVDLNGFKEINDAYGHGCGDGLLTTVAERMRAGLREADTIARLGSDDFAVILTNVQSPNAAVQAAEKVVKLLGEPCVIEGNELVTGVSIGISLAPQDAMAADQVLKFADLALYDAKSERGAGFRFFHASMNERVQRRRELQLELRRALDTNGLEVHYQPKFTLPERRLCGTEALLRWPHPQLGMVPPAEFIPVAEDTGLIIELGAYVLREACRQNRDWQQAGGTVPVAVNLSAAQFARQDLVALVTATLEETGLDPRLLELEITESVLLRNAQEALAVLNRLRDLGIVIALDDFGTGYSSLSYLHRFPIDKLKIDRSFIAELGRNASSADIVRIIISLARTLHLTVVAEGVETAAQLSNLERMGCDEVQGFYLEMPQPAPAITAMLTGRQPQPRALAAGD